MRAGGTMRIVIAVETDSLVKVLLMCGYTTGGDVKSEVTILTRFMTKTNNL